MKLRDFRVIYPGAWLLIATGALVAFVALFFGIAIAAGTLVGIVASYLGISEFVLYKMLTSPSPPCNQQASTEPQRNAETISFESDVDQVPLKGLFLPSSGDRAIVLVHGLNSNSREIDQQEIARAYVEAGFHVLVFDLRAHGSSGGDRRGLGWVERWDVRAAVNLLLRRKFEAGQVGIHGTSYGAATALLSTAVIPEIGAVIADSAFADVRDVMDAQIGERTGVPAHFAKALRPGIALVARVLHSLDFDAIPPERAVSAIAPRPILFIHGSEDAVIPIHHGQRLKAASRNPADELWILEGFGHTEGVRLLAEPCEAREVSPMREAYLRKVVGFFDRSL